LVEHKVDAAKYLSLEINVCLKGVCSIANDGPGYAGLSSWYAVGAV
jgi:hypothetical protein